MSKDRIESVQIDPVVALRISSCYSEDKAHEGLTIVSFGSDFEF